MSRPLTGTTRRDAMRLFGGVLLLAGCSTTSDSTDVDAGDSCAPSPTEGAGPFVDKVGGSAFERSDIREGRPGTLLTIMLSVVDTSNGCAALANADVVIWQADADGHYSEYADQDNGFDGTGETFLRGVLTTNAAGQVTFLSIYPGWYAGRAAHLHIEVLIGGVTKLTTQLAFPETASAAVYTSGVYAAHGVCPIANVDDAVFFDSLADQLLTITGDPSSGYTATFTLGVAA